MTAGISIPEMLERPALLPENSETPGAATPEASGERINKSTAK